MDHSHGFVFHQPGLSVLPGCHDYHVNDDEFDIDDDGGDNSPDIADMFIKKLSFQMI